MVKYPFETEIVFVNKNFTIIQDFEVPIPSFFIIGAKRKINSILDLNDKELMEFAKLLKFLRKGLLVKLKIKEVYLFQNEDSKFGFHLWIFPRHEWMEKFGRKIQSVRPIMNYAKENMMTPEVIDELKKNVRIMKLYFDEKYE
jgi:diadenosine tetraphosphate (Ap4A) HIT family hydrolase